MLTDHDEKLAWNSVILASMKSKSVTLTPTIQKLELKSFLCALKSVIFDLHSVKLIHKNINLGPKKFICELNGLIWALKASNLIANVHLAQKALHWP